MTESDDVMMDTTTSSSSTETGGNAITTSNAHTTIDPSVVQSRILQSASIAAEDTKMNNDDNNDDNNDNDNEDNDTLPKFPALHASDTGTGRRYNKSEYRRIRCPAHRYTPLREHWEQILTPLVEFLRLQVRFHTRSRSVELKTSRRSSSSSSSNTETGALQKGADFVSAFMMGFEVCDAVALLRIDDLYLESFQVTDIKSMLRGDHLSRAVGRIAGQDGKTRFAIENATRTRIVIADKRIHMLGSYANIRVARNAVCDLVMGAPPGKVYNNMRNVAKRMNERF